MHINNETRQRRIRCLAIGFIGLAMIFYAVSLKRGAVSLDGYLLKDVISSRQRPASVPVRSRRSVRRTPSAPSRAALPVKRRTSLIQSLRTIASTAFPSEEKLASAPGAFGFTVFPVDKIPDWATMRSALEWDRRFEEMPPSDFVPVPAYDLTELTIPAYRLEQDPQEANLRILTAKLFYSTRFFGRYSIDSGEFQGTHPGIDLKLAAGTPVGSIAGGRVYATGIDPYLGNFVMVLHVLPEDATQAVSVYGHLEKILVTQGQFVAPGTIIGRVGSTGRSSGPHLHLQVDALASNEKGLHAAYSPSSVPGEGEASEWTIHPIRFIEQYQGP